MNPGQRIHISVFLLGVLFSVLLFSFGFIDRASLLWASVLFFAFGELAILVNSLYRAAGANKKAAVAKDRSARGLFRKV